MKDYRPELKRAAVGKRWKRELFTFWVNSLVVIGHLIDFWKYLNFYFPRRRFVIRRQPRDHYIGYPRQHPHRFAFLLLTAALIAGAIVTPGAIGTIYWSIAWGTVLSLWVLAQSAYIVFKRLRAQFYR